MMQPLGRDDPRVAGEFRLRARLGSGGMGQVYLGYSPAGRAVAVKICHAEFAADPAFVARFAREVAAARTVNGLYTAQVIDAGPDDSPPWLATSYVPGPSLHDAVTGHGPLPAPAVWRLAAGLAEALQAVHAHGLVHRDLKPANVLLAADGPRVIDFGIARALGGTSLTATGYTFGTPGYMAPEQADGLPATPASDVFALGSVLCFAATGDTPFGEGEPPAVLYRIVHAQPALGAVPAPLRGLIAACLAKDPADRPTLAQVLRTCQARAPQLGGPAASFWPGQVAALIARYQAGLDGTGLDGTGQALESTGEPEGEPTQTYRGKRPPWIAPRPPGPATRPGRAGRPGSSPGGGPWPDSPGWPPRGWPPAAGHTPAPVGLRPRAEYCGPVGPAARSPPARRSPTGSSTSAATTATCTASTRRAAGRSGKFPTSGAVSGGVTVAGGTLFAGSADQKVYAFRVGTGGSPGPIPRAARSTARRRSTTRPSTSAATTTTCTPSTPATGRAGLALPHRRPGAVRTAARQPGVQRLRLRGQRRWPPVRARHGRYVLVAVRHQRPGDLGARVRPGRCLRR